MCPCNPNSILDEIQLGSNTETLEILEFLPESNVSNGAFYWTFKNIFTSKSPVAVLESVSFNLKNNPNIVNYPVSTYKYFILNTDYDPANSIDSAGLKENEFRLQDKFFLDNNIQFNQLKSIKCTYKYVKPIPPGPPGPPIPGFGLSIAPKSADKTKFNLPEGYPPDLNELFNKLKFLLPGGSLQSPLNPNYGKDIMDQVIKLLDGFMPFLMMYKFFLPLLKLILCVIEILCAIPNPFKLIKAIKKLFRECIPEFLNLFPILAIILMIISLFLLLFQLLEYIVYLILKVIKLLINNIRKLNIALQEADPYVVLAIAQKIGVALCLFQNLFVVFSMFLVIFQIIKDILALSFGIPPCSDGEDSNCCSPDVCPQFMKNGDFTRSTGTLQALSAINYTQPFSPPIPGFDLVGRAQSFQIYDVATGQGDSTNYPFQQFINMVDAKDNELVNQEKPILYPTDSTYDANTPPKQAPYTVDMKLRYYPSLLGRNDLVVDGQTRYVIFKDCIVVKKASSSLVNYSNSESSVPTGVLIISGGKGYESDGATLLYGYDANNQILPPDPANQATLNNFLTKPAITIPVSGTLPDDGYVFSDVEYTFKINYPVLLSKALITSGCNPDIAIDKNFAALIANDKINGKLVDITFPDIEKAQQCVSLALDVFRSNVTEEGAIQLQDTLVACIGQLQQETAAAITNVIPIAFDQYESTATLNPSIQFTTKPCTVNLSLKDTSGVLITNNIPAEVGTSLAAKIQAEVTLGEISSFTYDGVSDFTAQITSDVPGKGKLKILFDNKYLSDIIRPTDLATPPSVQVREIEYQFIYAPAIIGNSGVGIDSDGQPRRDSGDVSRDMGS